jgi:hypothetical protein
MPKTANKMLFWCTLVLTAACWSGPAVSQDGTPRKFSGDYSFYSGTPGEIGLPTKKDAKVRMEVRGPLALRMFQYMGIAATQSNSCVEGEEVRIRDQLICSRNKTTGKAECDFGFDLHSGKSVHGTDC